jgi:hypothetical protein
VTSAASDALDLALVNGVVRRSVEDRRPVQAIGVRAGTVVVAGTTSELSALAGPATKVVDLRGRSVMPAFIDSHTHFHRGAVLRHLYLDFAALRPTSVGDVVAHVRRRAAELPAGAWIQGDSLSLGQLAERRLPDRQELDAATERHPVLLRGIGKHVIAANSAALAAAGITRDTADPPGGRIERDADETPTGILHERAKLRLDTSAADTVVPSASRDDRLRAVRAGVQELHRLGITTIHEMIRLPDEAGDLAAPHAAGELDVRVRLFYRINETPFSLDWLSKLGIRRGLGDDRFRVLGVKISVDGWCIFRNAAVYEGYLDASDERGILRIEPDELCALVRSANAQGLGIAVHAVGARAVDLALDAFEAAGPAVAGPHRLEHAHLDVDGRQLRRVRALGLVLSGQPGFLRAYRPDWDAALPPDRIDRIMPLGLAHSLGIPLILNSDYPAGPLGPIDAIHAAVTRDAGAGRTIGSDQAIPRAVAWSAFTTGPARCSGDSALGSLEPGRRADLVVLEEDPLAERTDLRSLSVTATMLDGRFVHGAVELAA